MEYQLQLANQQIKELQEKLLIAESAVIEQSSEQIATIEYQERKIEQLYGDLMEMKQEYEDYKYQKEEQLDKYECYCKSIETQLDNQNIQISEMNRYILYLERELQDVEMSASERTSSLMKELDYQKKSVNQQIEKFKSEYSMQLIESQDKVIRLRKIVKDKENSIISHNSSVISTVEPFCELQNELNKNIRLLNLKLKNYSSKQ